PGTASILPISPYMGVSGDGARQTPAAASTAVEAITTKPRRSASIPKASPVPGAERSPPGAPDPSTGSVRPERNRRRDPGRAPGREVGREEPDHEKDRRHQRKGDRI